MADVAKGRLETLHEVFRPKIVRVWTFVVGALFLYDVLCNQFGFPKLPQLWGMSGSLLPWWAWLILLQLGFTYGLFEFVRRMPDATVAAAVAEMGRQLNDGVAAAGEKLAAPQAKEPLPRLTDVEREKCAEALHDVHELLVTDVKNLNGAIAQFGNQIQAVHYAETIKAWAETSVQYERKLRKLLDRHGLIFDKIGIDFRKVQTGLMEISVDTRDVRRALDWPAEALAEKAQKLVGDNSRLIHLVDAAKEKIKEKRRDYLDK